MATHIVVLGEIRTAWRELETTIARVSPERAEEAGVTGAWSVKDLIGHITTWENEAMTTIRLYVENHDLKTLAWPDVDSFNARSVESKRATPYAELRDDFNRTHKELVEFVKNMESPDLEIGEVEKRVRVDTFAHYREHTLDIQRWLREFPEPANGPRRR